MASLQAMANSVRARLDDPLVGKPSLRHTFRAVCDAAQAVVNRSSATGKPWSIQDVTLQVVNGTADYVLPVDSSYGKPLSVLSVYTQNPSYQPRYIEFYCKSDLFSHWGYPANLASWIGNWDGSPNTAARMAFWKKPDDPSWWVTVLPTPQLSATYLCCFSQGTWASDASIESSPLLAQFHPLIEMWATTALLEHSEWYDAKDKEGREANTAKRKGIEAAQRELKTTFDDDFSRFIRTTDDPGLTTRNSVFGNNDWGGQ